MSAAWSASTLAILVGLPGSGKSTLARSLAAALRWEIVDRDRIRAAMFPRCTFSDEEKAAAGEAVWLAVEAHLEARRSCIVDGMTFALRRDRLRAREIAQLAGARCVALALECPVKVASERVGREREHLAGDRDAALVKAVASRFEPLEEDCVRVDATAAPDAVAQAAISGLRG